MSKKALAISLVAAISSVAVYAYIKSKRKARRKNLPMMFM